MTKVHHHQHVRKRVYKNLEKYPHPNFWKRLLDKAIFYAGFINIFATFPQVYKVYVYQDATGLSTITWAWWVLFSSMMILYGLIHKELPIIGAYAGSFVLYVAILIGSILY